MHKISLKLLPIILLCFYALQGRALEIKAAASVNGDVISILDLERRFNQATKESGQTVPEEHIATVRQQILQHLIEEKVKFQLLKKIGLLPEGDELKSTIENIEENNKLPPGGLFASFKKYGISEQDFNEHIATNVGWARYINILSQGSTQLSSKELKALMDSQLKKSEKHYLLATLVFSGSGGMDNFQISQDVQAAIEALKSGAPFPLIANQRSTDPSAASGGDIGFIAESELDDASREAVKDLLPGQISEPVEFKDKVVVYLLRDVKYTHNSDTEDVLNTDEARSFGEAISQKKLESLSSQKLQQLISMAHIDKKI